MAPLSHGLYGTSQGVGWPVAARAGLTLPGSGVLLRHGDTITDRRAWPGLACRVQTVQADFISLTYSFQGNESPKP